MNRIRRIIEEQPIKVVAVVVVITIIVGLSMVAFIRRSIHDERTVHLKSQTETTRNLINKTIEEYSNFSDICTSIISAELEPGDNVHSFMNGVQDKLYMEDARLILIDENCIWYGEGHSSGKITSRDSYLADTPGKVIYITRGVDVSVDGIVCRVRLNKPITVTTDNGTAQIAFVAVICYMDKLEDDMSIAFPYKCNKFIVNDKGFMLYKEFYHGKVIKGSNVFSKYDQVDFLYGNTGKEELEKINNGTTSIAEFKKDGTHYFVCTARLKFNNWYICYIMDTGQIASGSYFTGVSIFIIAIGILIALATVIIVSTQLKNQQIEEASKAKSIFLSNMSHDIRTPINGIVGTTALAAKEDNPPKTKEYLKKIEDASMHLLSLVNDVLDMSSIESGKVSINNEPADIRIVADSCTSILEGQILNRKLEFIKDFDDIRHPYLALDELKLKQILINILGNAVKFTEDGGRISFCMKELPGDDKTATIEFKIEDTGIGMKPEFLAHIWDRFVQEDDGSRTNYQGTGLGMAITKNFVDMMGGTIEVESVVDEGSRFTVRIPFAICDKPEIVQTVETSDGITGMRILLAEDNELNIEIATELLEDEGAIVTVAHDGEEVLEAFKKSSENSYDVILMDIMMPKMNGLQASRAIRALDRKDANSIPIIAMTANALGDDIKASQEAGMNAHLTKPIDINAVVKTIAGLFHKEV